MRRIDLHTHSTASDGTYAPGDLVQLAAKAELCAVALTDHDCLDGLTEAQKAGEETGVEVVRGVELSVADEARKLHILGLFLPRRAKRLEEKLETLRRARDARNGIIVEKLKGLGVDIELAEAEALAEGAVGRPHIARILLDKGVVRSFQEAFDKYLGARGRAYAPKDVLPIGEAFDLLRAEGATVVLAHPYLLQLSGVALADLVKRYADMGLGGIEAHYTEHSPSQTREYLALAERFDLAVTGGSDFHGAVKPDTRLGTGRGKLCVPGELLDRLRERRAAEGLPV